MSQSHSFQDIFSSENSEQAKDMILNNVRFELNRRPSQAPSESGSEDSILHKNDQVESKSTNSEKPKQKTTKLLVGPKFQYHTIESKDDFKQKIIYPVSVSAKAYVELDSSLPGTV